MLPVSAGALDAIAVSKVSKPMCERQATCPAKFIDVMDVMMFIRFVAGHAGDDHRALTGIFAEARILRDDGAFVPHELAQLEETFDWFNRELPCPPFASERWPREAASWFKDGAQTAIARMWTIVHLLDEHDVPTRVLRSKSPGKVLYEDDWQVVVLEWKHL